MTSVSLELHSLREVEPGRDVAAYDLVEMRRRPIPWDGARRVMHPINCGQNLTCSITAYTWKGVVLREEQSANYEPPADPEIPDRNPRGCQKGICFAHRMYDPQRLKYPLKRVGERGEGRWERISWDQALTEIADRVIDLAVEHGPRTILNAGGTHGEAMAARERSAWVLLSTAAGMPAALPNAEIGDDHQGALETFGNSGFGSSAEDWYLADMIFVWNTNPSYTQITWYHYLAEARYNGTKIVVIAPDYSPSAIQADEWVPIRPGTDAALGLAMSQVIVAEGLYDEQFVKEQSDLPLLVREDNGKFLRESDVVEDGRPYVFYVFDRATGKVTTAPHTSLTLEGLDPALEGEWTVTTTAGEVEVTTTFSMLRSHLDGEYTPAQAESMCGVPADTITRLAREFAAAGGVVNLVHYNVGRFYHGNLIERAMILNWVLCGHLGKPGANYNAEGAILVRDSGTMAGIADMAQYLPRYEEFKEREFSDYRILKEVLADILPRMLQASSLPFFFHAGLFDLAAENGNWDPHLTRPLEEWVQEALASGTRTISPERGTDPTALVAWGGDPLRRIRANHLVRDQLLPKLDLVVTVDWRWSGIAYFSDYVLPVCGYYEKTAEHLLAGFWQPIAHFNFKAAEPLYESRSDYWISVMLLKRLAERAREREIGTRTCPQTGALFGFDGLDAAVTANGVFDENAEEEAARDAYEQTRNVEQLPWEQIRERGWAHFTSPGLVLPFSADFAGDLEPGQPAIPLTRHTAKKEPYNTLTGRIQTYVDHDWYLELGEGFARHKEPPRVGGDHPINLSGGHSRWSIHTLWAEDALMLQLQRGEPLVVLGTEDAAERGIVDGDLVEVFNDVSSFLVTATVTPRFPAGFGAIYHAWTNAQFRDGSHFQQVMPSPFNPLEFVPVTFADYPNLASDQWAGDPGFSDRDTRVEIRKAG